MERVAVVFFFFLFALSYCTSCVAKETNWKSSLEAIAFHNTKRSTLRQQERASVTDEGRKEKLNFTVDLRIGKDKLFFF